MVYVSKITRPYKSRHWCTFLGMCKLIRMHILSSFFELYIKCYNGAIIEIITITVSI